LCGYRRFSVGGPDRTLLKNAVRQSRDESLEHDFGLFVKGIGLVNLAEGSEAIGDVRADRMWGRHDEMLPHDTSEVCNEMSVRIALRLDAIFKMIEELLSVDFAN
jgi:hypothetical protein